jgi:hypothetical protein
MNLTDNHFKKIHNYNQRFLCIESDNPATDWTDYVTRLSELIEHTPKAQKQNSYYYVLFEQGKFLVAQAITGFINPHDEYFCLDKQQGECLEWDLTQLLDSPEIFDLQQIQKLHSEIKEFCQAQNLSLSDDWQWVVSEGIDKDGTVGLKWMLRVFTDN